MIEWGRLVVGGAREGFVNLFLLIFSEKVAIEPVARVKLMLSNCSRIRSFAHERGGVITGKISLTASFSVVTFLIAIRSLGGL